MYLNHTREICNIIQKTGFHMVACFYNSQERVGNVTKTGNQALNQDLIPLPESHHIDCHWQCFVSEDNNSHDAIHLLFPSDWKTSSRNYICALNFCLKEKCHLWWYSVTWVFVSFHTCQSSFLSAAPKRRPPKMTLLWRWNQHKEWGSSPPKGCQRRQKGPQWAGNYCVGCHYFTI